MGRGDWSGVGRKKFQGAGLDFGDWDWDFERETGILEREIGILESRIGFWGIGLGFYVVGLDFGEQD